MGDCALRLTRRYPVPPEEVWAALTDPESRARWLGRVDVPPRTIEPGRVLELRLGDSVARIEITVDGETTKLVLDHERIPAALGMRFLQQWTRSLEVFDREVHGA